MTPHCSSLARSRCGVHVIHPFAQQGNPDGSLELGNARLRGGGSPTPADLLALHPCPADLATGIDQHRQQVRQILSGDDDRLLVVIGPCSIHDPLAALDYARRLAVLAHDYRDRLQIVMRTYFEKPAPRWAGRTGVRSHLDGSNDIGHGLQLARQLLRHQPAGAGHRHRVSRHHQLPLPGRSHQLGAIGARTTESQVHRQLASALPCPIGFKNGTDGNIRVAIDAIQASKASHLFTAPRQPGRHGGDQE